ncbi:uncharacterized protein tep1 isoform X2 [Hoplias malabaricus]|uniref:uncharacterized protein tep1 isoform X2 n=1 Tax=Hoplias malabaricus TaxID=27720 RepID=UPI00346264C8
MKPLTLFQSEPQCGVLSRTSASRLENRILTQSSSTSFTSSSCPALQPSVLSSTQLRQDLFLFTSSSLCSSHSLSTMPPTGAPPAGEHLYGGSSFGGRSAEDPCTGEDHDGDFYAGGHSGGELSSGRSSTGEPSAGGGSYDGCSIGFFEEEPRRKKKSEQDAVFREPTETLDRGEPMDHWSKGEDVKEWRMELREDFEELVSDFNEEDELLKEKKYKLLNLVCCSLVNKSCSPGQKGWDDRKSAWTKIQDLAEDITSADPEFLLKVAVYSQHELKKPEMVSFLLALASHLPNAKPHLRRYFTAAVLLPSDWLQVPSVYRKCFSAAFPSCLRKSLVEKFKQFSVDQLSTFSSKSERNCRDMSSEVCEKWANLLRTDPETLQKQKDQCEYSMKKLIKHLHIKEPAELVMSLLGKKYPADVQAFESSGLPGVWQSERAGRRMKLKKPETWRSSLSREGDTAETWEKLIDSGTLPFGVFLKNLRKFITHGISSKHHNKVLKQLTSESAVFQSELLPLSFLTAYKAISQLSRFVDPEVKLGDSKLILLGILKKIKRSSNFQRRKWQTEGRRRLRAALGVPFISRLYTVNHRILKRAGQRRFNQELLERYLDALMKAVQISCRYNIPLIPGNTLICVERFYCEDEWAKGENIFLPPDPPETPQENLSESSAQPEEPKSYISTQKAAVLLAMMLRQGCEHSQVLVMTNMGLQEAPVESDNLLESVMDTMKMVKAMSSSDNWTSPRIFFSKLIQEKMKVDNIITVSDSWPDSEFLMEVDSFRKRSSCVTPVINVVFRYVPEYSKESHDPHTVYLHRFTKHVLKFISLRGSSRFLEHVENMDKLHSIPPPVGDKLRTPEFSLTKAPSCLALSLLEDEVVLGTEQGTLHVYNTDTLQEVRSLVSSCDGVCGCVFLDKGIVCISSCSGQVEVWDVHSGSRTAHLDAHSRRITGCDVSLDREFFATVSLDFKLKVWRCQELQQVASLVQPSTPNCVAFDPEGVLVAVGCWDGRVGVWDWKKGQKQMSLIGHHSSVQCVLFCPSSSSLLCSGSVDGELRLWSASSVACVWHHGAHCGSVEALSFLPDGETLLSAGRDRKVQLWSAGFGRFGSELQTVENRGLVYCHRAAVRAIAIGHHGQLYSASDDLSLRVWRISNTLRLRQKEVLSVVCFLKKRELLVFGFSSGRLEIRRRNSKLISSKQVNNTFIQAVCGLNDERLAVACSDRSVAIWKLEMDPEHHTADLSKVCLYSLEFPVSYLLNTNVLLGVCIDSSIVDICSANDSFSKTINTWSHDTYPLGVEKNDAKSLWVLTECNCKLKLIFVISANINQFWRDAFFDLFLGEGTDSEDSDSDSERSREEPFEEPGEKTSEEPNEMCAELHEERCEEAPEEPHEEPSKEPGEKPHKEHHEEPCEEMDHEERCEKSCEKEKPRKVCITAAAMDQGFIVCGDAKGFIWTNEPPSLNTWRQKRRAHSDQVSVLRLTDQFIISASHDGAIKLWNKITLKQVGVFVGGAPVEVCEVCEDGRRMVCGDTIGEIYFLSWTH